MKNLDNMTRDELIDWRNEMQDILDTRYAAERKAKEANEKLLKAKRDKERRVELEKHNDETLKVLIDKFDDEISTRPKPKEGRVYGDPLVEIDE